MPKLPTLTAEGLSSYCNSRHHAYCGVDGCECGCHVQSVTRTRASRVTEADPETTLAGQPSNGVARSHLVTGNFRLKKKNPHVSRSSFVLWKVKGLLESIPASDRREWHSIAEYPTNAGAQALAERCRKSGDFPNWKFRSNYNEVFAKYAPRRGRPPKAS